MLGVCASNFDSPSLPIKVMCIKVPQRLHRDQQRREKQRAGGKQEILNEEDSQASRGSLDGLRMLPAPPRPTCVTRSACETGSRPRAGDPTSSSARAPPMDGERMFPAPPRPVEYCSTENFPVSNDAN